MLLFRHSWRVSLACVALGLALAGGVTASEPGEPAVDGVDAAIAREVRQTIAALGHERYSTRERASRRLDELVRNPALAPFLSGEISRALLSSETSVEARVRLEPLLTQLPPPSAGAPAPLTADEIGSMLSDLASNASAARAAAERRLDGMLVHVELIAPLLAELKRQLAHTATDRQTRQTLATVLDKTRAAWLLADPEQVPLPPVSAKQLAGWVEDLVRPERPSTTDWQRRAAARQELTDLVVRDDTRDAVLALVREKQDRGEETPALKEIADLARPAMAIEVWGHETDDWEHRQHKTVKYLHVGVPQFPETALRPTHFDRIDEKSAHCVTSAALAEGDYPVGVAIADPILSTETMYYLVNLPTPRRRLVYENQLKRRERDRLLEISQRTLADFLGNKRVLTEGQVMLLAQLEPRSVSRFVASYFQTVPNHPLATMTTELTWQQTVHGGICHMLTRIGTRDAVPILEQTARTARLGAPTYDSPHQIAWIAALAIAKRDPWPGVDAWLADLVREKTTLVTNLDPAPELGACAAGLLIERHAMSPGPFGLEPTDEIVAERLRFSAYYFPQETSRQTVEQWWKRESAKAGSKTTP